MLLIGLTGSIATGKSTVSRLLSSPPYDLPIIDADLLARQVVAPGTIGYKQIVSYFLPTTPDLILPDNAGLNRPALGKRVFGNDPERQKDRKVLNGIVHPLVRKEMRRAALKYYLQGHWAVALDIPLLFESRLDLMCGAVLVVSVASEEMQMQRLLERDSGNGLSREDAEHRVRSQMPLAEKRGICREVYEKSRGRGWVIRNDGDRAELEKEVARVMAEVSRGRMGWWKRFLWVTPPAAVIIGVWVMLNNWLRRRKMDKKQQKEKAKL